MIRLKANRSTKLQDDKAEVGIGTLIVFIATILVAAVASAVLINTSNKLQEKAQATGSQATQQVATNLKVDQVVGKILTASGTSIDSLNVTLELAAGAKQLDMNQLVVRISDGTAEQRLTYTDMTASGGVISMAGRFGAQAIRDADSSWSAASPVMTAGDLILVNIDLSSAGISPHTAGIDMTLDPRVSVEMQFVPEVGAPVSAEFVTPATYATDTVFTLS